MNLKGFLQPDNIIWIQKEIKVAATVIETGKSGVTAERESLVGFEGDTGELIYGFRVQIFHESVWGNRLMAKTISATVILIFRSIPDPFLNSFSSLAISV